MMTFFCTIILIFSTVFWKRREKYVNYKIDAEYVTPADFTVMITNLPLYITE